MFAGKFDPLSVVTVNLAVSFPFWEKEVQLLRP